jgi:hypothetical protein
MINLFLAELKNNARLRLGVAFIFGVLWVYAILLLRDAQVAAVGEYRNASVKLARLQAVTQQGDWGERLNAARTLQAEMEGRLWRGATIGLARASFQDLLNQQMQQAGVTRPAVSMGSTDEENRGEGMQPGITDDLWKVKAKLAFDFNPLSFNKLFVQLANHPHPVVVESLHVTKEPVLRVEAVLLAYFQKPDPSPAVAK